MLREVSNWVLEILEKYDKVKIPIHDFNFPLLPNFHSEKSLKSKFAIIVDKCPILPFSKIGLDEFSKFENKNFKGITYSNCYFITSSQVNNEPLHFHELVHTYQWEYYGIEQFLQKYAYEIITFGYDNSPLEIMAYKHQEVFESSPNTPYDIKASVFKELKENKI